MYLPVIWLHASWELSTSVSSSWWCLSICLAPVPIRIIFATIILLILISSLRNSTFLNRLVFLSDLLCFTFIFCTWITTTCGVTIIYWSNYNRFYLVLFFTFINIKQTTEGKKHISVQKPCLRKIILSLDFIDRNVVDRLTLDYIWTFILNIYQFLPSFQTDVPDQNSVTRLNERAWPFCRSTSFVLLQQLLLLRLLFYMQLQDVLVVYQQSLDDSF